MPRFYVQCKQDRFFAHRKTDHSKFNDIEISQYGGNPVSCAIANAVLDVIEREQLLEHARVVGARMLGAFCKLASQHALIGDVRGVGLFVGIELVRDRNTREPATMEAQHIVHR